MEIKICVGTSCHLNGSYNVVQSLEQLIEEYSLHDEIELEAHFCMKECKSKGVSIKIEEENYRVDPENIYSFFKETILNKVK